MTGNGSARDLYGRPLDANGTVLADVGIIIPSWDNEPYLAPCVASILTYTDEPSFHIYVVNNGRPESCDYLSDPRVTVVQAGRNRGWEGGLKLGLEHATTEPYLLLCNDDIYIPPASRHWLSHLLAKFHDARVGAVGPCSNAVMGLQNIFATLPQRHFRARFLVGFCLAVRRSALEAAGGIDDTLPGGDDLDLSIRLRGAGYSLIVDREVFIFHHGFKTGERVFGTSDKAGGWNSREFREKTDAALIRKHGFRTWWECMQGTYMLPE